MIIKISDEFDLEKIVYSGQCFRPRKLADGSFLFITADEFVKVNQIDANTLDVSCDEEIWNAVWKEYFDLEFDYSSVRAKIDVEDTFMLKSGIAGEGIRILRQDKWEMIISYIISQRKSIPAIRTAVEKICLKYGKLIGKVDGEEIYSFPTAQEMALATSQGLSECGLGYRVDYVLSAVECALNGSLDFSKLEELDDESLFLELKKIKGVGDKVANCVMLFAYHRIGRAPVDTWILKVINEQYGGVNPFDRYGNVAGVMQQYVFYYVQNRKGLS